MLRLRDPTNSLYIERFAGTTGVYGYSGDGGDARAATFGVVAGIAVGTDGWVYVADSDYHVIRSIAPDGTISTLAGTGGAGYSGDGGPAALATLQNPVGLAFGPDGSLFVADASNHSIRRIDRNGIITTVAGVGTPGYGGDGGAATSALLSLPFGVAVGPDRTLYIADTANHVIRQISPAGIISTIAGQLAAGDAGDSGPALLARFTSPVDLGLAPDGSLYVADLGASRIRHIERPLSGFSAGDILVPSEDGTEVYVFDAQGRHQETRHGLTGAVLYSFIYDPISRLLVGIEDGDGNLTQIVRAPDGTPQAIVGPDGQGTTLAIDANGYLDSVKNPADETTDLTHAADGLLVALRDARQNVWTFAYDDQGRLLRDDDPVGGYKTLARTEGATGYEVAVRSAVALGPLDERVTAYQVAPQPGGGMTRAVTRPDGTVTSTLESADGGRQTSWPDGRTRTVIRGADPRFGLLAARPTDVVTTSGSVVMTSSTLRAVTPPDPPDPFSFTQLAETTSINGRSYERAYDPTTRTWTLATPAQRQQVRTIDSQGRTTRSAVTGLHPLRWEYDTRGRLSAIKRGPEPDTADTRVTTFAYKTTTDDQNGYLDQVVDAVRRVVAFDYDDAGRVIVQTFQPGTPDQRVVAYEYDENGNLTSLTPPGRPAHGFAHTAVNLEQEYDPPDIPLVLAPETTYGYDLARELTAILRPDGRSVLFDSATGTGQLASVTLQPESEVRPYSYAPITGQLQSVGTPDALLSFAYDGALPQTETWSLVDPPVSHTVTHGYDADFRLQSLQVDALPPLAFGYDDDSLLTGAGALALTRDADNGLLRTTTLVGGVNVTDTYTPSPFGEVDAYGAEVDGVEVYAYTIDLRDTLGRIVRKTETIEGVSTQLEYGYDAAGRLADVWRLSSPAAHLAHYAYDANGNRLGGFNQVSGTIVPASAPSAGTRYDDQDRLTQYETTADGVVTYAYTPNGDLETKTDGSGETTFTYDAFGNLRTVVLPSGSTIEYLVDGRNRRIGKRVNGTFVQGFLYKDQLEPVAELGPDGSVVAEFIYGSKRHVPDYMIQYGANAGTHRILSDHLGSPRIVVDLATGATAQRIDYDEFGSRLADTSPGFQPFGFAGGIADTALNRFGARDYDGLTGRWMAKDPIRFDGGGSNLFAYSLQDPINLFDQTGRGPAIAAAVFGFCTRYNAGNVAMGFVDPTGLEETLHTVRDQIWRIDERRSNTRYDHQGRLTHYETTAGGSPEGEAAVRNGRRRH